MACTRGRAGTGLADLDVQQENFCRSSAGTTCCHWASTCPVNGVTGQRAPCPPTVKLPSDAAKTFLNLVSGRSSNRVGPAAAKNGARSHHIKQLGRQPGPRRVWARQLPTGILHPTYKVSTMHGQTTKS